MRLDSVLAALDAAKGTDEAKWERGSDRWSPFPGLDQQSWWWVSAL